MKKKEDYTQDMNDSRKYAPDPAWKEAPAGKAGTIPEAADAMAAGQVNSDAVPEAVSSNAGDSAEAAAFAEGAASPKDPDPGEKPLTPEEQIACLEAKLAEASDNYLRKAADFENFRKRMNQEKANAIDYANQTLLLDLASVIDDFERAIKSAETQREAAGGDSGKAAAAFNSLYEGISLIEKNLLFQLENKWGLKRFDSAGELFDPNRHEAIMMEKSAEQEEPVVAEEFIKGYLLKDRVIRPAKVKVVMPEK